MCSEWPKIWDSMNTEEIMDTEGQPAGSATAAYTLSTWP